MDAIEGVVAVYSTHAAADEAVKKLFAAGFTAKALTVIGKGYHSEEQAVGFYTIGDRVKFWGQRGAFWGGLWGLFFGGIFLSIPIVGQVVVLGFLAAVAVSAVEGALVVGGLSALGAAIYSIGIPKESIVKYETALKSDGFIVMAHGNTGEVARAKAVLAQGDPLHLDIHRDLKSPETTAATAPA